MRKRGKYWHAYDPRVGEYRTTRCTDRKAADLTVAGWQREHADPAYRDTRTKTLADGYELIMRVKAEQGKPEATLGFYREKLGQIARVAERITPRLGENTALSTIAVPRWVDEYIAWRREEGIVQSTIAKELSCLRQLMRHAARRGWVHPQWRDAFPIGFSPKSTPRKAWIPLERWQEFVDAHPARHRAHVAWAVRRLEGAVPWWLKLYEHGSGWTTDHARTLFRSARDANAALSRRQLDSGGRIRVIRITSRRPIRGKWVQS